MSTKLKGGGFVMVNLCVNLTGLWGVKVFG